MPETLLTFARAENATQLVLGVSRRLAVIPADRPRREHPDHPRLRRYRRAYRDARPDGPRRGLPRAPGGLTLRRRLVGYALAVVLAPLLTLFLASLRGQLNLTSDVLLFLVAVIAVALVGGFVPALVEAIACSMLLNFCFTPPLTFTIAEANNVLALVIFVAVGLVITSSSTTRRGAPRRRPGRRRIRTTGHHGGQRAARPACPRGRARPGP